MFLVLFLTVLSFGTNMIYFLLIKLLVSTGILLIGMGQAIQYAVHGPQPRILHRILSQKISGTSLLVKIKHIIAIKWILLNSSTPEMDVLIAGRETDRFAWELFLPDYLRTLHPNYLTRDSLDSRVCAQACRLFSLFEIRHERKIDMRPYCLLTVIIYATGQNYLRDVVNLIFDVYAGLTATVINRATFENMMVDLFELEDEDINAVFNDLSLSEYILNNNSDNLSRNVFMEKILPGVQCLSRLAKTEIMRLR